MASGGRFNYIPPFQVDMAERYAHLQGFVKACWGFIDAGVVRCYWMPGNLRYIKIPHQLGRFEFHVGILGYIRWDDGRSTFVCFFFVYGPW